MRITSQPPAYYRSSECASLHSHCALRCAAQVVRRIEFGMRIKIRMPESDDDLKHVDVPRRHLQRKGFKGWLRWTVS
jgi:hypothetical protein